MKQTRVKPAQSASKLFSVQDKLRTLSLEITLCRNREYYKGRLETISAAANSCWRLHLFGLLIVTYASLVPDRQYYPFQGRDRETSSLQSNATYKPLQVRLAHDPVKTI